MTTPLETTVHGHTFVLLDGCAVTAEGLVPVGALSPETYPPHRDAVEMARTFFEKFAGCRRKYLFRTYTSETHSQIIAAWYGPGTKVSSGAVIEAAIRSGLIASRNVMTYGRASEHAYLNFKLPKSVIGYIFGLGRRVPARYATPPVPVPQPCADWSDAQCLAFWEQLGGGGAA